jgi:hypothetical protein
VGTLRAFGGEGKLGMLGLSNDSLRTMDNVRQSINHKEHVEVDYQANENPAVEQAYYQIRTVATVVTSQIHLPDMSDPNFSES